MAMSAQYIQGLVTAKIALAEVEEGFDFHGDGATVAFIEMRERLNDMIAEAVRKENERQAMPR